MPRLFPPGAPVTICSRPGGFRSCSGYFGEERNLTYCLCRESNKIPQSSGLYLVTIPTELPWRCLSLLPNCLFS